MNCGIKAGIVSIYEAESKGFATTQACKEIFNPNVASEEQIESEGGRDRTEVYAASRVPLFLPIRLGKFGCVVRDADRAPLAACLIAIWYPFLPGESSGLRLFALANRVLIARGVGPHDASPNAT
jgi:hypothetical protein